MKEEKEEWMIVADRLYRHANPATKMDTPSHVYEIVNKWRNEWWNSVTGLNLFEWCIQNKQKP